MYTKKCPFQIDTAKGLAHNPELPDSNRQQLGTIQNYQELMESLGSTGKSLDSLCVLRIY